MNVELVEHISEIIQLKKDLCTISKLTYNNEIMKIWARWIITHRGLFAQKSLFLPDDDVHDTQFIQELVDKGCPLKHAQYIHLWLWERTNKINKNYNIVADAEFGGIHGEEIVVQDKDKKYYHLNCGDIENSVKCTVYNKLKESYEKENTGKIDEYKFDMAPYVWVTTVLYGMLDGKGLQWAVPPAFLQFLKQRLKCNTELFASPINHHYDKYYSLFELDRVFGSSGNFFNAPDSDFNEGCFQVNPPFIDSLFTKTTVRLLNLLEKAEEQGNELTFIYVMPLWTDFPTHRMVTDSRYCVRSVTLQSNKHSYYEYSTGAYIKAKFNTAIVFLSTDDKICDRIRDGQIQRLFMPKW